MMRGDGTRLAGQTYIPKKYIIMTEKKPDKVIELIRDIAGKGKGKRYSKDISDLKKFIIKKPERLSLLTKIIVDKKLKGKGVVLAGVQGKGVTVAGGSYLNPFYIKPPRRIF